MLIVRVLNFQLHEPGPDGHCRRSADAAPRRSHDPSWQRWSRRCTQCDELAVPPYEAPLVPVDQADVIPLEDPEELLECPRGHACAVRDRLDALAVPAPQLPRDRDRHVSPVGPFAQAIVELVQVLFQRRPDGQHAVGIRAAALPRTKDPPAWSSSARRCALLRQFQRWSANQSPDQSPDQTLPPRAP